MTLRSLASFLLLLLLSAALGCGESHGDEDTSIDFDATMPPDGGTEDAPEDVVMPPASDVGSPCESAAMCDELCIEEEQGFPDGYCTADCSGGAGCPDGSICTQVGRGVFICFDECDPSAEDRTCRMGYGCASSFMLDGPVCLPGCYDDTDCGTGLRCDPDGGFAGEGTCFDPDSMLGDACTDDVMCPAGGFCLGEGFSGWPGGACIRGGCEPDTGSGCEAGEECLPAGRGGACFAGCASDADCRDGYECSESSAHPGREVCTPGCTDDAQCSDARVCNPAVGYCDIPFDGTDLGQECSTVEGVCGGGTCLTEFESGFPFSYCAYFGCDPEAAPAASGCPAGGVCAPTADGTGVCGLGCSASTDCTRDGYDCLPSDAEDPTSATACLPACTLDASCANPGFECNEGTGRCRPPFDPASLGERCELVEECEGGRCLDEPSEGWPSGTCAFPGCRLSGTGPAEMCPSGSVCADDGRGDSEIGHCLEACSTMTSSCRPGYTCVVSAPATDGYCGPSCTSDTECTGGRTCDGASGLCS